MALTATVATLAFASSSAQAGAPTAPVGAEIRQAGMGISALAAGNPCGNGYACLYYAQDYGGAFWAECLASTCGTNWAATGGYNRSAKNRMGNRPLRLGVNLGGGSYDVRHCMNPGQEVSNANGAVDSFKIGNAGGSC